MEAAVFKALGDPIRLRMMKRLSSGSSFNITSISYELGITRQGARKHLQVLIDAQVVRMEPQGREMIVQLNPDVLEKAKKYIDMLGKQWEQRLGALKDFVEGGK
ncbi:MAG: ArsR/SmtB family transcription factor [Candidatus Gracilibacteria bacterium]